ncbi:MAG: glycosyltransferase [Actinomycetota bacterium]|nr:glycosyltransferase [Actinomycetota bacterium]
MNVYVRELVSSLAQAGIDCTVFVRRWREDLPPEIAVEPGFRVVHVDAGDPALPKEALAGTVPAYTAEVLKRLRDEPADVIHANYWLSGMAGHQLKHELELPLVSTFHTLARVKAETGDVEPQVRVDSEAQVIACSDAILASCTAEAAQLTDLYGADPARVEIVPPGVDHAFFSPGDRRGARAALGLGDHAVLLFVGRIQPLKGLDVAVRALAELGRPDATLLVVGGASGAAGDEEVARVHQLVKELDLTAQVRFVPPQPHHLLSTYYRAADVCLVPSRSESFGLVALESTACGTPVVAAAVGGLRTLVQDGRTGFLIESRDPGDYAAATERILSDRGLSVALAAAGASRALDYTWSTTAARLRRVYADLSTRSLVDCDAS